MIYKNNGRVLNDEKLFLPVRKTLFFIFRPQILQIFSHHRGHSVSRRF
jgi:hypothetical protein